jgi:hypothetical protein
MVLCDEGLWPSDRGQDARDTQGRDALATQETIPKLRLTRPCVILSAAKDPGWEWEKPPIVRHHSKNSRAIYEFFR